MNFALSPRRTQRLVRADSLFMSVQNRLQTYIFNQKKLADMQLFLGQAFRARILSTSVYGFGNICIYCLSGDK